MKKLYNKNLFIFIAVIFLFPLIQLIGGEVVNKKVKYLLPENISQISSSDYLSEIIEIPIENPEPFIAIGFNAKFISNEGLKEFYIRTSPDKIKWNNWQLIREEENSGEETSRFLAALSFYTKENKFIQFKTNSILTLKELIFSFISPGKTPVSQIEKNLKQARLTNIFDNSQRPPYVNRKAWGCPQDENVSSRTLTNVTHLIIHHSAVNNVSSDYGAVVLAYWDYHVNSNGWDDIGYNWLVDPNGVLYKGRAWKSSTEENVQGAHNTGKNGNTAGICFIGNYMSAIPSEAGLNKLADISAFLCDKYSIDPLGSSYHAAIEHVNDNITGHKQSGGTYGSHSTSCPGTQIINRLQYIRELTFNKILDTLATPEIVLTYPDNGIDSVYLTKKIYVEFTHPMNKPSVEDAFIITPGVFGNLSWNEDGNIIYFDPLPAFNKQTNYRLTISKTAMSYWNVPLLDDVNINFISKASDNLSLVSTFPQDGAVSVPTEITVELHFDGPLDVNSLGGNIFYFDVDSNQVSTSVNVNQYSDGIINFTLFSHLNGNTEYSIYLKEGISTTDGYTFGKNKTIKFTTETVTSVNINDIPMKFILEQNYPNPFNPSTTIKYSIPNILPPLAKGRAGVGSQVTLKVYDILGKEVATLVNEQQQPGNYKINFDAKQLSAGVYYYQLKAGDLSTSSRHSFIQTKKMLLLK